MTDEPNTTSRGPHPDRSRGAQPTYLSISRARFRLLLGLRVTGLLYLGCRGRRRRARQRRSRHRRDRHWRRCGCARGRRKNGLRRRCDGRDSSRRAQPRRPCGRGGRRGRGSWSGSAGDWGGPKARRRRRARRAQCRRRGRGGYRHEHRLRGRVPARRVEAGAAVNREGARTQRGEREQRDRRAGKQSDVRDTVGHS